MTKKDDFPDKIRAPLHDEITLIPDPDRRSDRQRTTDLFREQFKEMMKDPGFRAYIEWKKEGDK